MSDLSHHDRDLAAVSILTAYYAIHHSLALTPEDRAAIACDEEAPSPATWSSAVRLLGEASETSQPTCIYLRGFSHMRCAGLGLRARRHSSGGTVSRRRRRCRTISVARCGSRGTSRTPRTSCWTR